MRGFFGGLIIGLITLVITVVGLSLLSPATQRPDVADGAPQTGRGVGAADAETDAETGVDTTGSDGDLVELAPTAPGAQAGARDDLSSLDGADTKPGDKPSVGAATTGLGDPGRAPQAPEVKVDVAANNDAPVASQSPVTAPSSPGGDSQPAAIANPAQPSMPDVSQSGSGFGSGLGAGPVVDDTSPEIASRTDPALSAGGADFVASAPGGVQTPAPSTETAEAPKAQSAPVSVAAPDSEVDAPAPQVAVAEADTSDASPAAAAVPTAPVEPPSTAVPVPQVDQSAPQKPVAPTGSDEDQPGSQVAALPQAGAEADASDASGNPGSPGLGIGKPVVPLTERGTAPAQSVEPAVVVADPVEGPPLSVYAQAFDNSDGRPLMAIVLIDDDAGLGAEALAEFPYPLSFAVDPNDPQATAKMARYREAGFEVVALVEMPVNATAQDAEVNLSVWLETLPQAVALLEGTDTGFQGNRDLSQQVAGIAKGAGMGLIMQARGLNTAYKLAARDGVTAALVFRDFDGAGQSPTVMRRFLDQAAFRAGQQGAVIMLGRLRPDTISALLIWGLQDRASRVALAPVSAVLTRE